MNKESTTCNDCNKADTHRHGGKRYCYAHMKDAQSGKATPKNVEKAAPKKEKPRPKLGKNTMTHLLFWSFRYGFGRKTSDVFQIAEALISNQWELSVGHRDLIIREIKAGIKKGQAGMAMDVREWEKLLKELK